MGRERARIYWQQREIAVAVVAHAGGRESVAEVARAAGRRAIGRAICMHGQFKAWPWSKGERYDFAVCICWKKNLIIFLSR